jgi:hypothetical protein
VDSRGRTIFVADAHRGDGKRFVVRADEKLTAFVELESAIRRFYKTSMSFGAAPTLKGESLQRIKRGIGRTKPLVAESENLMVTHHAVRFPQSPSNQTYGHHESWNCSNKMPFSLSNGSLT